jgi:dTDP-4-dehydrorhamnose reductase
MLGHKLYQQMSPQFDVSATIRGDLGSIERLGIYDKSSIIEHTDVTDPASIRRTIEAARPDCVVNAVGIIKQNPSAKNLIQTLSVNSIFPHRLAELAAEFGFRLISISTDCVFDGAKGNYVESDSPDARDLYGMSKFLGEITSERALTLRTSIIGRELFTSQSLAEWFLSNRGGSVRGFKNVIYTGFPSLILAEIITDLIWKHPDLSGIYHLASEPISKFDLLTLLNESYASNITIEPDDEMVIDRSLDSSRFRSVTGFKPRPWREMVERMAADPTPYKDLRDV